MTRITIVPSDQTVIKDGVAIHGLNMSSVANNIHAVQWDGNTGWIEYTDNTQNHGTINSLASFSTVLGLYDTAYAALTAAPSLEEARTQKINGAFSYMNDLLDTVAVANVLVSAAGNTYHLFGCDRTSRENITGINAAISSAIGNTVPDPRTWLPKGELAPINVSHEDLAVIGGATLAKVDQYFQVYFVHKANIMAANNANTVLSYDFTTGYGGL